MMKESTKAKRTQTQIALYLIGGGKPKFKFMVSRGWPYYQKIWHLPGDQIERERHCSTCHCYSSQDINVLRSLCGTLEITTGRWMYNQKFNEEDLNGKRPCKKCLQALSKIANS